MILNLFYSLSDMYPKFGSTFLLSSLTSTQIWLSPVVDDCQPSYFANFPHKIINQKTGMGNSEMETVGRKCADWFQRVWCRGGVGAGFGNGGEIVQVEEGRQAGRKALNLGD
jgi:hypothetical protein